MIPLRHLVVLLPISVLFSCSVSPPAGNQAETNSSQALHKTPTLYTAKQCFVSMLSMAQRWQPDALPFHLESESNEEATGQNGKATVWRGFFASRSRGTMKAFTCSGSHLPTSPAPGFTDTAETPYAADVPGLLFESYSFLVDSDKAYLTTLDHGGSALIRKDAKQPIVYLLDWDSKKKQLLWWVIYGKSADEREGLCTINATSGAFLSGGK